MCRSSPGGTRMRVSGSRPRSGCSSGSFPTRSMAGRSGPSRRSRRPRPSSSDCTGSASSLRHKAQPLRDVASMLRSFSYLQAALERAGDHVLVDWRADAREQFLAGYRSTPVVAVLPAAIEAQDAQLALFELEKAFYEVRYEFDHRPDWVDIPIASITDLLDRGVS